MKKRVLIIGSLGMLGQELAGIFSTDENYQTIAWDVEDLDITDQAQVEEKILVLAPQIIINAAAYNDVDKCEESAEFEKAKTLNGLAPGYLAKVAKEVKIPPNPPFTKWEKGAIFVHYSSDYVFSGDKKEGYKEDDGVSPINNYGLSKVSGELEVRRVEGRYYLIRLQRLFGRPGKTEGAKKSFFEAMLALSEIKKELEAVDDELANFTYAPDLAERTKYIIEQGLSFGVYHVTNEGAPVTWFGAAKALFEMVGKTEIRIIPVPAKKFIRSARRPRYSILLNTKLPPLRPWPEALKEFLNPAPFS